MRDNRHRVMAGRRAVLVAPFLLPGLARAQGHGQPYPDRPIRVIVPFAPGGASDLAARILQPHLQEMLGQAIVIENRTGAAGNVGMEVAARATPDGATLYLGNVGTLAVNPSVFSRTLKVRPTEDFTAISLVSDTPDGLVAHPSAPFDTVAELVAYARANPGKVNYGSPGAGSLNRLEMELLREVAGGLDMVHVPYPGGAGPAVTAAVAGDVHCLFVTLFLRRRPGAGRPAEGPGGHDSDARRGAASGADHGRGRLSGLRRQLLAGDAAADGGAAGDRRALARGAGPGAATHRGEAPLRPSRDRTPRQRQSRRIRRLHRSRAGALGRAGATLGRHRGIADVIVRLAAAPGSATEAATKATPRNRRIVRLSVGWQRFPGGPMRSMMAG